MGLKELDMTERLFTFPSGPVVKTRVFNVKDVGSISGQGTKIAHALWRKKKKKKILLASRQKGEEGWD